MSETWAKAAAQVAARKPDPLIDAMRNRAGIGDSPMTNELITAEVVEMARDAFLAAPRLRDGDKMMRSMRAALTAVLPALIEKAREEERAVVLKTIDDLEVELVHDETLGCLDVTMAIRAAIRARTQPETQEPTP